MGQVIPLRYVDGSIFTWHKSVGVTEESTLIANGYEEFGLKLTIKSHKTGKFMDFLFKRDLLNEDGDVLAWVYKSATGVEVHILND